MLSLGQRMRCEIAAGRATCSFRFSQGTRPSTRQTPLSGRRMPLRILMVVDFPALTETRSSSSGLNPTGPSFEKGEMSMIEMKGISKTSKNFSNFRELFSPWFVQGVVR